jgi:NAD-dependent SIR2 family protein deacetylase
LPIQNKIIDKMTEEPDIDFLSGKLPRESIKFLNAYIAVGLFLLDNYGKENYQNLAEEYVQLHEVNSKEDHYYAAIYILRNKIRLAIRNEKINVNLEDIFTSFDKSVISRQHLHKYTYAQMDEIQYSITRLFIYYFSKSVREHSFKQDDYRNFIRYIKEHKTINPITLITTNWDTLVEEYCKLYGIKYNYGFQTSYTSIDIQNPMDKHDILLLKIHGSANWLKCLHCGAISVFENNEAAESLFEDGKQERCAICGQGESLAAQSLQPEIITPTMLKSFSDRVYSNLWGAASMEIRAATHIIFIGYSFPIADFDFRYMLQKNISPNAKIEVVLYKDDDPDQTDKDTLRILLPEKRYRDTFPKNNMIFYYCGFNEYFDRI